MFKHLFLADVDADAPVGYQIAAIVHPLKFPPGDGITEGKRFIFIDSANLNWVVIEIYTSQS